eukprot:197683-Pleurochrysis_carterae.AAC.3
MHKRRSSRFVGFMYVRRPRLANHARRPGPRALARCTLGVARPCAFAYHPWTAHFCSNLL